MEKTKSFVCLFLFFIFFIEVLHLPATQWAWWGANVGSFNLAAIMAASCAMWVVAAWEC
jgi:hypothetical protein